MRTLLVLSLIAATPAAAQTLVVGNKGEDSVSFVDLPTARERARLPAGRAPHEVAISPDGRQAAVVAYGGTSIDVYDIAGPARVRTIDIAPNSRPHGLVWLGDGRLVATAEGSRTLVVVGPGDRVASVPTAQEGSHMVAVTPDRARAYVANIRGGTVSVIDLAVMRKLGDIATGGAPEGIAVSRDGRELWVGDNDAARLTVWRIADGTKAGEVALSAPAIRVLATPAGIVTSSMKAGSIDIVDPRRRRLTRTIPLGGAAAEQVTILPSADGRLVYVAETAHDRVAEVRLRDGRVLRRIAVGRQGDGLAIAP